MNEIEILTMPEKALYILFTAHKHYIKDYPEKYSQVRFGINFNFDFYTYLDGEYYVLSKQNAVIIEDKPLAKKLFLSEIENRKDILITTLLDLLKKEILLGEVV